MKVASEVDDAVGTEAEDGDEFQTPIGDAMANEVLVLLIRAR